MSASLEWHCESVNDIEVCEKGDDIIISCKEECLSVTRKQARDKVYTRLDEILFDETHGGRTKELELRVLELENELATKEINFENRLHEELSNCRRG